MDTQIYDAAREGDKVEVDYLLKNEASVDRAIDGALFGGHQALATYLQEMKRSPSPVGKGTIFGSRDIQRFYGQF